jgi:hypothetical protein
MGSNITGWKWRDEEITMKQFYLLPQEKKIDYICSIEKLPAVERSSMDELLLNRFGSTKKNNYFTLED